jgi:hypothetical protein
LEYGTPFVLFVTSMQGELADDDKELLWKVLKVAHESGKFGGVPWQQVKDEVEITVEAPQVARTLTKEETDRRQTLVNAGIMSDRTWAAQEDLDYEQEQSNGATVHADAPIMPQGASVTADGQPVEPVDGQLPSDVPTDGQVDPTIQTANGLAVQGEAGLQTELTLNGAQVTAAVELLTQMAAGNIAPEAALELLIGIGIPRDRAQAMIAAQSKVEPPPEPEPQTQAQPADPAKPPAKKLAEAARLLWGDYPGDGGAACVTEGTK